MKKIKVVSLACNQCGRGNKIEATEEFDTDHQLRFADVNLELMHKKNAYECMPVLQGVLTKLVQSPAKYKNIMAAFGDYKEVIKKLVSIMESFEQYPKAQVQVIHYPDAEIPF